MTKRRYAPKLRLPVSVEDALKALLQTPPPPEVRAKKTSAAKRRAERGKAKRKTVKR